MTGALTGTERSGISPNASGRGDRPAFDHGVVAYDRKFVGEVGDRASVDRCGGVRTFEECN